ncbi:MAG TPA: hypothetical protein PKV71_09720, partial [Calditrichia bacterium]|nr:hypothetical protein [Calditrichia bacterium]
KKIDVGKINDRYFFNIAGSGIDAKVSLEFDRSQRRGFFSYLVLSTRELFRYRNQRVTIKLPDRVLRREPLLLSFANLPEFGNRATIAPGARPDDGLLDICILNPISPLKLLRNLPLIFSGRIDHLAEMEIYRANKVTISRPQSAPIHTDGDPHLECGQLEVELLPEHLTIALPHPVRSEIGKKRWFSI